MQRTLDDPNQRSTNTAFYFTGESLVDALDLQLVEGRDFEEGRLSLDDLRSYAVSNGEPKQTSGRQEWLENIINNHI